MVAAALALTGPSMAEDDLTIEMPPLLGDGFSLRLAGYAWAPRFDGDVKAAGPTLSLRDDLGHGGTRWAPWGEVELRWNIWDLRVDGYTISEDASTTATRAFDFGSAMVASGDRVSSELSIDSLQVEGGVALWRPFAARRCAWESPRDLSAEERVRAGKVDLRFGAVFGLRWIGLDHDVRVRDDLGSPLGADSRDADWLALYAGPKVEFKIRTRDELRVIDHIVVSSVAGFGGVVAGGGGTMLEVRAGIDLMFTPNLGLSLGYRLQNLDFDDGDYTYDGSLQGLVIGGVLRF